MQLAAHELGIPLDAVFIAETATDKVPNASPTAASASSDMYGGAVMDACRQINERLEPYRKEKAAFTVRPLLHGRPCRRVSLPNSQACKRQQACNREQPAENISKPIMSTAIYPKKTTASHDEQGRHHAGLRIAWCRDASTGVRHALGT